MQFKSRKIGKCNYLGLVTEASALGLFIEFIRIFFQYFILIFDFFHIYIYIYVVLICFVLDE
jgi:hypothetical protein